MFWKGSLNKEFRQEDKKKSIIAVTAILIVLVGLSFFSVKYFDYISKVGEYNGTVSDYNVLAEGYISLIQTTSVDNIDGMPTELHYKKELHKDIFSFFHMMFSTLGGGIGKLKNDTDNEIAELATEYRIAEQITNPSAEWVAECLKNNEMVTGTQQVTEDNDPNGYLGVDGGYTGCVYFALSNIDFDSIEGKDIISKGVDAGGAVEIYKNVEDAMVRCEYLAQFDNTLLYSGSYALVGTMIIRTSYKLSNEDQIKLTKAITESLVILSQYN